MSFSIADVEHLARSAGPDKSLALLRTSTEVYVRESSHSDRERRLFQDIVADLFDTCGNEGKRLLATLVAAHPDIPKPVLRLLYRETIDIARPVILRSPALDEFELLRIAGVGNAHMEALAERPDLPLVVLQAIFMQNNRRATAALIANRSVSLDPVPLDKLIAAAGTDRSLCDQLALRQDIPGDRLIDLFLELGRAGRQRVVAAVEHRLLGASLARKAGGLSVSPPLRSHYPLYKAIFSHDRAGLVSLLSQDLNLRRTLVERIVDDATGEPLAILLKATGIPADRAIASFADINPALGQTSDLVRNLTRFYDRISVKAALHIIDKWRISHPGDAAAPPHLAAPEQRLTRAESLRELAAPAAPRTTEREAAPAEAGKTAA